MSSQYPNQLIVSLPLHGSSRSSDLQPARLSAAGLPAGNTLSPTDSHFIHRNKPPNPSLLLAERGFKQTFTQLVVLGPFMAKKCVVLNHSRMLQSVTTGSRMSQGIKCSVSSATARALYSVVVCKGFLQG